MLVARVTAAASASFRSSSRSRIGARPTPRSLVGLAFAIASAANLPAILFTLFWKRFNTYGAVAALIGGTVMTIWLYAIGPGFSTTPPKAPLFPLANVGIVSIPFGFLCAIVFTWLGDLVGADRLAEKKFHEIDVRAYTGLGAEPAAEVAAAPKPTAVPTTV